MQIYRILNTNAVISKDAKGREIVLIGSGLGFKAKIGDVIDPDKIQKQFSIKDDRIVERLQEMFSTIAENVVLLSEKIIAYGKKIYNLKLNDSIHFSLAEHINLTIENAREKIYVPNTILDEIKQFYLDEYEIGLMGLEYIYKETGLKLPEDEAGFIAMHFVNAEAGSENTNAKKIIKLVNELNELIKKELGISFDENSNTYHRYMTHLKFFASRIINMQTSKETDDDFKFLAEKFAMEYACSKKVAKHIYNKYAYKVSSDEVIYLTIHLANITK